MAAVIAGGGGAVRSEDLLKNRRVVMSPCGGVGGSAGHCCGLPILLRALTVVATCGLYRSAPGCIGWSRLVPIPQAGCCYAMKVTQLADASVLVHVANIFHGVSILRSRRHLFDSSLLLSSGHSLGGLDWRLWPLNNEALILLLLDLSFKCFKTSSAIPGLLERQKFYRHHLIKGMFGWAVAFEKAAVAFGKALSRPHMSCHGVAAQSSMKPAVALGRRCRREVRRGGNSAGERSNDSGGRGGAAAGGVWPGGAAAEEEQHRWLGEERSGAGRGWAAAGRGREASAAAGDEQCRRWATVNDQIW
uniref:Uncharacterized protein n=1 Tax=Oryza sativa subsp. japonica TaxID=39947 RepID=Q6K2X2_ORYSJ|nr:hypothetical protein [Oryza sativa Japonica Group]